MGSATALSARLEPVPGVEPTDLLGVWDLARRIVDRPVDGGAPRFGRVVGTLTLAPDGEDVAWCEEGVLTWAGHDLPVTRGSSCTERPGVGWCASTTGARSTRGPPARRSSTTAVQTRIAASSTSPPIAGTMRVVWDVSGPDKDRRLFTRCTRR